MKIARRRRDAAQANGRWARDAVEGQTGATSAWRPRFSASQPHAWSLYFLAEPSPDDISGDNSEAASGAASPSLAPAAGDAAPEAGSA